MIRVSDDDDDDVVVVVFVVAVDLDPDREGCCFPSDFFWSVNDVRDGGGGGSDDFEEGPFA